MSKLIGCVYKDFAKGCTDHYYDDVTIEKFSDRGFDYLLTQGDDVIGMTEKQFFTLYMEMKREIDNIDKESPQECFEKEVEMSAGMDLVIKSYLRLMGVVEKYKFSENCFMLTDGINNLVIMESPNHIAYNGSIVYSEGENI